MSSLEVAVVLAGTSDFTGVTDSFVLDVFRRFLSAKSASLSLDDEDEIFGWFIIALEAALPGEVQVFTCGVDIIY